MNLEGLPQEMDMNNLAKAYSTLVKTVASNVEPQLYTNNHLSP